jgi:hypothetical protein
MNYSKRIVCLADSKKPGGRCVAGKEVLQDGYGGWIRPVSARPSAEINLEERQYEDGREPQILDVIEIPMLAPVPRVHQTENHMIEAESYWTKVGELPWQRLADLADSPPSIWGNGDSTFHGRNDRMTQAAASQFHDSLCIIQPSNVAVRVLVPGAAFGNPKRRARARFTYKDVHYDFMVTDPIAERVFLARPNGEYNIGDVYFCISLAEAHTDGYCYKLVATIISERAL